MTILSLNRHLWLVATLWAAPLQGISFHKFRNAVPACSPAPGLLLSLAPEINTHKAKQQVHTSKAVRMLASLPEMPFLPIHPQMS